MLALDGDLITIEKSKGIGFWLPAIIGCLAQMGASGDNSVLSISTHELIIELGANMAQIQLANIVYSLIAGALMVFGGMLGLAIGFKKTFLSGAFLAFIGEIVAIYAPSMDVLIWGARAITGLGAALMVPSILGIIVSIYTGKQRALAFGGVGASTGVAAIIMPIGAGYLMDNFGYQSAFGFMACWFLFVFLCALKYIPKLDGVKIKMDYKGTVLISLGLGSFIIGCSKISVWGLFKPLHAPFLIFGFSPALFFMLAGILVVMFTFELEKKIEKKSGSALIPAVFLKTRQVRNGLYVTGLIFALFSGVFFVNISWMILVAGQSGTMTGVVMAFMALPMILFSIVVPKYYCQHSPRKIVFISTLVTIPGILFVLFSLQLNGYQLFLMLMGLVLLGSGLGGLVSQSAMIVSCTLNSRDAAQASGIQCSVRNIWQATAVSIVGSVLLFSSSTLFKSAMLHASVAPQAKEYIQAQPVIGFMSNTDFIKEMQQANFSVDDTRVSLLLYKETRMESAQYALGILIILVFLHIPGFFAIPTQGWEEKLIVECDEEKQDEF